MHTYAAIAIILANLVKLVSPQVVDPNTIDQTTKNTWCSSQKAACPLLCLQITPSAGTNDNTCNTADLSFSCVCSNGVSPNSSEYSQTIPYFLCTTSNTNCVNSCSGDSSCQSACRTNHPCGAQNPTRANTSTITTMSSTTSGSNPSSTGASTTGGGNVVNTGFGDGSATATAAGNSKTSSANVSIITFGQTYGLGLVLAAVFGGFTFLL